MSMKSTEKKDRALLDCLLTDPERLVYAKQLSEAISNKAHAESELESFRKQQNAKIASHDANISLLSERLNTGREYRLVPCTLTFDWDNSEVRIVRDDTGELVKVRRIEEEERQEHLDLQERGKKQ